MPVREGLIASMHAPPEVRQHYTMLKNKAGSTGQKRQKVINGAARSANEVYTQSTTQTSSNGFKFSFTPFVASVPPAAPADFTSSLDTLSIDDDLGTTAVPSRDEPMSIVAKGMNDESKPFPPPAPEDLHLTPVYLVHTSSTLPNFSIDDELLRRTGGGQTFCIETLAAGIAQACSAQALEAYLDSFPQAQVAFNITKLVRDSHPVLFYAAERGCKECVRLLLDRGCNANGVDVWGVPVLAFAVMRSKWTILDPTDVVKMLLVFGARPYAIPEIMWKNFIDAATTELPESEIEAGDWCTPLHCKFFAQTLSLSVRYCLYKASTMKLNKQRGVQIGEALDILALLKMPYLIIGQDYATKTVANFIFTHLLFHVKEPLVFTFVRLSGHGKTDLAKQMGGLLKIAMTVVDCAQMGSDVALFGPRMGYVNNSDGSQLNNFLAENSGKRSVVFMDEFDKTGRSIHNSLLLVLDSGEYRDRRTNKIVDASKTIWIMASNYGDRAITEFYNSKLRDATSDEKLNVEHDTLIERLKRDFRNAFGAPIAGRMKNIAPFFPFDRNERAVVVHKFLMELVHKVRQPIDTSALIEHYPEHLDLTIKNDGKLRLHLAEDFYLEALGARSLSAALSEIRVALFAAFVDTDERISSEMDDGPLMKYTVRLQPVKGGDENAAINKVIVAMDGYSDYYRGQMDTNLD